MNDPRYSSAELKRCSTADSTNPSSFPPCLMLDLLERRVHEWSYRRAWAGALASLLMGSDTIPVKSLCLGGRERAVKEVPVPCVGQFTPP
jgi:hypothetical protein